MTAANDGSAFCYSNTAHAFNNGEILWSGPWDTYRCFRNKTNTSDLLPTNGGQELLARLLGLHRRLRLLPDRQRPRPGHHGLRYVHGLELGLARLGSRTVRRAAGFVHVPIAFLDATQVAKFNTKLGTSQFAVNAPLNPAFPLQNAGLTPLQGTLLTAT